MTQSPHKPIFFFSVLQNKDSLIEGSRFVQFVVYFFSS